MAQQEHTKQQPPSQQVAKVDPRLTTLRVLLMKSEPQFQAAIPRNLSMSAQRLVRVAMTAIQKTPDLLKCDPRSIMAAVMECAQLGLVPDGVLGHCYILPFDSTKKGSTEASFLMGYKGYVELAHRSGKIHKVESFVAYERDEFDVEYGTDPKIHHVPYRGDDPGAMIAAYAVFHMRQPQFTVLWPRDIKRSMAVSKTATKDWSPWKTHAEAMWKKTAIRIAAKTVPMSPEMQRAVALDDLAEEGIGNANWLGEGGEIYEVPSGDIVHTPPAGTQESQDAMKAKDAAELARLRKEVKEAGGGGTSDDDPMA